MKTYQLIENTNQCYVKDGRFFSRISNENMKINKVFELEGENLLLHELEKYANISIFRKGLNHAKYMRLTKEHIFNLLIYLTDNDIEFFFTDINLEENDDMYILDELKDYYLAKIVEFKKEGKDYQELIDEAWDSVDFIFNNHFVINIRKKMKDVNDKTVSTFIKINSVSVIYTENFHREIDKNLIRNEILSLYKIMLGKEDMLLKPISLVGKDIVPHEYSHLYDFLSNVEQGIQSDDAETLLSIFKDNPENISLLKDITKTYKGKQKEV